MREKDLCRVFNKVMGQTNMKLAMNKLKKHCEYIYFHSINVCKRVIKIGIINGYPELQIMEMGTAALLLDIGYLNIPKDYMSKKSYLIKSEFEEIKKHPLYSKEIASEMDFDDTVTSYILNHHEMGNGSGYPHKIKENRITKSQSEINVADKYEALLETRPYRPAKSKTEATELVYYMCNTMTEIDALKTLILTEGAF